MVLNDGERRAFETLTAAVVVVQSSRLEIERATRCRRVPSRAWSAASGRQAGKGGGAAPHGHSAAPIICIGNCPGAQSGHNRWRRWAVCRIISCRVWIALWKEPYVDAVERGPLQLRHCDKRSTAVICTLIRSLLSHATQTPCCCWTEWMTTWDVQFFTGEIDFSVLNLPFGRVPFGESLLRRLVS